MKLQPITDSHGANGIFTCINEVDFLWVNIGKHNAYHTVNIPHMDPMGSDT